MFELYKWTLTNSSIITLLIAFCVIVQTLLTVLRYYRRPHTRSYLLESLLEAALLFHIIVLSLLMGQKQLSHNSGLIVPSGYIALRYAAAACVVMFTIAVMTFTGRESVAGWFTQIAVPVLTVAVACLTLPFAETLSGNAYIRLYIAALLFWLFRGGILCAICYRETRTSISYRSVKDAVDSLHTGVLFSEPDGDIALINLQMQRLMSEITGKIHRNSLYFCKMLTSGRISRECRITEHEGQIVCLLPDETAWLFTTTDIIIKKKRYIQLTAADISERWALTAQLQRQEELLRQSSEELKEMIVSLQTLSRTRQLKNAKLRAHDVLGQRLTMLLHSISSGKVLDHELLRTQLEGLLDDLRSNQSAASPQDKLDDLRRTFSTIGVEIHIGGKLPEDDTKGHLFAEIISESVVNAVRHGFASGIFAGINCCDGIWRLIITDNGNGQLLSEPIKEGGGIGAMRDKLEQCGGSLVVTNYPRFILKAYLPGGITDV